MNYIWGFLLWLFGYFLIGMVVAAIRARRSAVVDEDEVIGIVVWWLPLGLALAMYGMTRMVIAIGRLGVTRTGHPH